MTPNPAGRQLDLADGAELIDVRPVEAFAGGHIPGALSIALRDAFASWLGWLVSAEPSRAAGGTPSVFLGSARDDRSRAVGRPLSTRA